MARIVATTTRIVLKRPKRLDVIDHGRFGRCTVLHVHGSTGQRLTVRTGDGYEPITERVADGHWVVIERSHQ